MKYRIISHWNIPNGETQPILCKGIYSNKTEAIEAFKAFSEEDRELAENNNWTVFTDEETVFFAGEPTSIHDYHTTIYIEEYNEINDFVLQSRIEQLKTMHNMMTLSNNEELYYRWVVLGVPDCPSEDDYEFIAKDEDSYNESFDFFIKLIQEKSIRY